ncbi:uncharacterized protein LOC126336065 [Schistocerca gregaria]|uniref:uncharacterized protein LOC126336065 n=1 Tax=Schistocerca gregaria TaxID=7010 RepID=UPI00211DDD27|nr:uncharacterized protein LOC126336065 [Schistocerca gregaria]
MVLHTHGSGTFKRYTRTFSKDDLCAVVAKAGPLPAHLQLVRPFCASTWAAASATLLAGGLVWRLLSKQPQVPGRRSRHPCCLSLLEACAPCVGASLHRPPPRCVPRIFLAAWLPAALVLSTAFQGEMAGSLAVVRWQRDPESLEQLPAAGPAYVSRSLLALLSAEPEDALSRLLRRAQPVSDVHRAARRIASEGRGVILLDRWEAERLARSSEHATALGLPRLHVLRRCPYQSYVAYEVPRRSALLPRLDRVLSRALQAGIPQHWRAGSRYAELVRGEAVAPVREPPPTPLRPQHLQVAFGLLAMGWAAAAVAFLGELAVAACRSAGRERRRLTPAVFKI